MVVPISRGVGVQRNPVVVVVVALVLLHARVAQASEPATVAEPAACRGALDAVHSAEVHCASPAKVVSVVAADAVVVEAPPARDPRIFPGELAFGAAIAAAAGGATLAATSWAPPASAELATGLQIGGLAAVGLSGLLAGAAVSFWAFNPTTGALQLPLFEGEPR
jgi:hypothetical protein